MLNIDLTTNQNAYIFNLWRQKLNVSELKHNSNYHRINKLIYMSYLAIINKIISWAGLNSSIRPWSSRTARNYSVIFQKLTRCTRLMRHLLHPTRFILIPGIEFLLLRLWSFLTNRVLQSVEGPSITKAILLRHTNQIPRFYQCLADSWSLNPFLNKKTNFFLMVCVLYRLLQTLCRLFVAQ